MMNMINKVIAAVKGFAVKTLVVIKRNLGFIIGI